MNTLTIEKTVVKKSEKLKFQTHYQLANFFNSQNLVTEVNLLNSDTEDHVSDEETTLIRFRVWDNYFSYAFLKGIFSFGGKPKGLVIYNNRYNKDFFIHYQEENLDEVLQYFEKIFSQLNKEIQYRAYLSKKIKLEAEYEEELSRLLQA
ncbi:MAG: hypothetical protein ACK4ND_15700 [Cytophagaceae bacterium]